MTDHFKRYGQTDKTRSTNQMSRQEIGLSLMEESFAACPHNDKHTDDTGRRGVNKLG